MSSTRTPSSALTTTVLQESRRRKGRLESSTGATEVNLNHDLNSLESLAAYLLRRMGSAARPQRLDVLKSVIEDCIPYDVDHSVAHASAGV
jgi:hypothetical protein